MKTLKKHWIALIGIITTMAVGVMATWSVLADAPGLKITSLGSNQFVITITNGVNTNYALFWREVLNNDEYPWQVIGAFATGETNFAVDAGGTQFGWFQVLVGWDQDGDGIPEWQDAQPGNGSVGILSLTIDSPLDGAVFQ